MQQFGIKMKDLADPFASGNQKLIDHVSKNLLLP